MPDEEYYNDLARHLPDHEDFDECVWGISGQGGYHYFFKKLDDGNIAIYDIIVGEDAGLHLYLDIYRSDREKELFETNPTKFWKYFKRFKDKQWWVNMVTNYDTKSPEDATRIIKDNDMTIAPTWWIDVWMMPEKVYI